MLNLGFLFFTLFICYVWFDTSAALEYSKLFRLKFFFYEEFEKFKENSPSSSYLFFLAAAKNCFFVRLITCPICLIVWICLFGHAFFEFFLFFQIISSWIGYFGLKKIIEKLNS